MFTPPAPTILVADDNRANREALGSLLETAGYQVVKAADGAEALERARAHRPRLIISDVLMPRMDGYELARRLREDPVTRAAGLIFYTAYFGERSAQDLAHAHGVARVLVKPSDNDVILEAVREVLAALPGDGAGAADAKLDPNLDSDHLRVMVDQLLQKTGALEAQQRRIERLNRTLSTLSAVNALIVRAPDRQSLLDEACRIAVETGGFGYAAIGLLDRMSDEVVPVAAAGEGSADPGLAKFPVEPRFAMVNDLEREPAAPGREAALRRGLRGYVVLPLDIGGTPAGALLLYARTAGFFDEDEMRLLKELAGDISFALHHLAQKARVDYLAYHDSLTGLPNRILFADRLAQALNAARREKRLAAVAYLDIQRFRLVNDTLGRKAGDELLRQVAERLAGVVRDEDTVGRMGSDHFAIAIDGYDRPDQTASLLIERIERAFAAPIAAGGAELRVAMRAGIAVFPGDGDSAEALSANAEAAMNRARDSNQSYVFYAPHMNERVAESLALENRLRRAIEASELTLDYQPKYDIGTGQVAGLEALIRWNDRELGQVPPSRFVALMEETGMILAAGRWALERAVEDIRHWRTLGLYVPRTSVNVSALQLKQTDFVDSVLDALRGFGEQPLLDLEITESVLVEDIEESTRKLQILRRAGVEVSVDDFGTGYSSLNYLARLPVDTLKIDRSFVISLHDSGYPRNIVAMIVSLAHTLGLKVIAEGVEEDEQLELLRELGCDQIQGYLTGRPMSADKIAPLLRNAA
ncbi:MAG TPA: EAL domain-containing protein [Burkholderiales bacterium]|nr:EAL domain-containing protein [Burkholderiales bacterium]